MMDDLGFSFFIWVKAGHSVATSVFSEAVETDRKREFNCLHLADSYRVDG